VSWNWPKGIVSYLISIVAVVGILTFLLLHPYGKQDKHKWIKTAERIFYIALIPLAILLFMAIGIRIEDYGITIKRALIVVFGIWLLFVAIYFSIKRNNIKVIPISLAVIIVLSLLGPWNIFSISKKSQSNRVKEILTNNSLLRDGKLIAIDEPRTLADEEYDNLKSILRYLDNNLPF